MVFEFFLVKLFIKSQYHLRNLRPNTSGTFQEVQGVGESPGWARTLQAPNKHTAIGTPREQRAQWKETVACPCLWYSIPPTPQECPTNRPLGLQPMVKNLFLIKYVKYEMSVGGEEELVQITSNSSGLSPSIKMQDKDRGQEGQSWHVNKRAKKATHFISGSNTDPFQEERVTMCSVCVYSQKCPW